ncbi:hypothetical protein ACF09Z_00515 [Streptomyces erythrochromogenes]|uniref:hypothetical protein n=1 Tax=Streptomyces erythrochromogenes TaxID=285574 RepID=UPI0036FB734A
MAGRLDGLPDLPPDCAAHTAAGDSGLALPASGTLLSFLFDGRLKDEAACSTRVTPRPGRAAEYCTCPPAPGPAELSPYPEVPLTAQAGPSLPMSDAPNVRAASALRALDNIPAVPGIG